MTTAIRTSCTEIDLSDTIGNLYYEYIGEDLRDEVLDSIREYIVTYVNNNLPENLTWYPYTSEIYVEFDPDKTDYRHAADSEDVDEMVLARQREAFSNLDDAWDDDNAVFLAKVQSMTETI